MKKKYTLENYVLHDDKTPYGGIDFEGETLIEFAEECGDDYLFDLIKHRKIRAINKELKSCGIERIKRRLLVNTN